MEQVLNLGLVAHVDAGKTTTTEQLLYRSGALRHLGSVDEGTAQTDFLEVEQRRRISVRSSQTSFLYENIRINLIDTPGHLDFVDEVEYALGVLDGAVLILSAMEGVQAQTKLLISALQLLKIPTLLFVNKCDRFGCDLSALPQKLEELLGAPVFSLNQIFGEGKRQLQEHLYSLDDLDYRRRLTEQLADTQEQLGEWFLTDAIPQKQELLFSLRRCCAEGSAFPLLYGAAGLGIGIDSLLWAIVTFLPVHSLHPEGEPSGVIYKVEHDKVMGKTAYLRLYRGTVKNRDSLYFPGRGQWEKVTQIRSAFGAKQQDTGLLQGGDIGVVCGLSRAKTGEWIGTEMAEKPIPGLAVPLFTVQIFPEKPEQLSTLVAAMEELSEESPTLDFEWHSKERELHIKILGKIQLEVLQELLAVRYGLKALFSAPSVIYKETPVKKAIGYEAYTMPKPCWAVIQLELAPLPRGSGLRYESVVSDREILRRYQAHIAATVPEALKQGIWGWEVTDLSVTLVGGSHHLIHTHPLDFFLATPMAVMNGLEQCGTKLLEPVNLVRIIAEESVLGRVIGDVLEMRGEFDTPLIQKGTFTLEARVPVATSMDYPTALAVLTKGKGFYSSRFSGYVDCPLSPPPIRPRRGVDPRDRSKWILAHRGAIQDPESGF